MNKNLPKVFANKIDKKIDNNKKINVSNNIEKPKDNDINKKINDIFSSYRYVYKADVLIKTSSGEYSKRIIGKKGNNLITFDNELININDILDISYIE